MTSISTALISPNFRHPDSRRSPGRAFIRLADWRGAAADTAPSVPEATSGPMGVETVGKPARPELQAGLAVVAGSRDSAGARRVVADLVGTGLTVAALLFLAIYA